MLPLIVLLLLKTLGKLRMTMKMSMRMKEFSLLNTFGRACAE